MDEQLKKVIETIRERMIILHGKYTACMVDARDHNNGRLDYADGMLAAYWEIDEMLDDVFGEDD